MKGFVILSALIGVVLSTNQLGQCDKCDSDFNDSNGQTLFKTKHNASKSANITSTVKSMHFVSVEGDINMNRSGEEAGTYIKCIQS